MSGFGVYVWVSGTGNWELGLDDTLFISLLAYVSAVMRNDVYNKWYMGQWRCKYTIFACVTVALVSHLFWSLSVILLVF